MNSKKNEINTEIDKLKQMASESECLKKELRAATETPVLNGEKIKQMNESCYKINEKLQCGIEEVYDLINNFSKINSGCDYNTKDLHGKIYSKEWACGCKSSSGQTENKITKLEIFRDEIFSHIKN